MFCLGFFGFFGFFSKVLTLLLKFTEVATETPKKGLKLEEQHKKTQIFPEGQKKTLPKAEACVTDGTF